MKSIILIILLALCACSPYQRAVSPVRMNYSVDGILCRDYRATGDTLILMDAGYFASRTTQRKTTEIRLIGGSHIIIRLK
jgi:hypothetical protein